MTSLPTTINLVTPPGSPAPMAEDDTRDGERGKQKVKDESLPLYDSDDSVVEMSQPKKQRTFASSSSDVASSSSCDQDDECIIVGTHGQNALVDFAIPELRRLKRWSAQRLDAFKGQAEMSRHIMD